jgi:hypothetical protein
VVTGDWNPDDAWAARWIAPPDRMLSPKDDITAAKDAARALLRDPMDVISEFSGEDPIDVVAGAEQLNKLMDAAKLVSDIDARKVGRTSTPATGGTTQDSTVAGG